MPQPDPLAVLARLRRLETDRARRLLAERTGRTVEAERRAQAAAGAVALEGAAAATPGDYGAWLVRGLAERERAATALALERQAEAAARAALAEARAAERAVERLREARLEAARARAARAEARALDEMGARAGQPSTPPPPAGEG